MDSSRSSLVRRGFTLIELLIVVAIIAILAAIAVPNFLEAQVRAKTTRVKGDFRTLANAMEAYFVDFNSYPRDHDNEEQGGGDRFNPALQLGWLWLTTPVSYITTLARDPFNRNNMNNSEAVGAGYQSTFYVLSSGSDNSWPWGSYPGNVSRRAHCYFMNTIGPDFIDHTGNQDAFPWDGMNCYILFYDPSNGTISSGDIYRFGGNYFQGDYWLNHNPGRGGDRPMRGVRWDQYGSFGPQS